MLPLKMCFVEVYLLYLFIYLFLISLHSWKFIVQRSLFYDLDLLETTGVHTIRKNKLFELLEKHFALSLF